MDDTNMLKKIRDSLLDQCNFEIVMYEHPLVAAICLNIRKNAAELSTSETGSPHHA